MIEYNYVQYTVEAVLASNLRTNSWTKSRQVLRVFLLVIQSPLLLCLEISNFLQFLQRRKGEYLIKKTIPPSLWLKKAMQKRHV